MINEFTMETLSSAQFYDYLYTADEKGTNCTGVTYKWQVPGHALTFEGWKPNASQKYGKDVRIFFRLEVASKVSSYFRLSISTYLIDDEDDSLYHFARLLPVNPGNFKLEEVSNG